MRIDVRHQGGAEDFREMLREKVVASREAALDAILGNTSERLLHTERASAARRGAADPLIQAEAQARGMTAAQVVQEILQGNVVRAEKVGLIAGLSFAANSAIDDDDYARAKGIIREIDNTV